MMLKYCELTAIVSGIVTSCFLNKFFFGGGRYLTAQLKTGRDCGFRFGDGSGFGRRVPNQVS